MGTFYTSCEIHHIVHRDRGFTIPKLLIDTGSECTWAPRSELAALGVEPEKKDMTFVMANGRQITRSVGFAILHVAGRFTIDEVVFAEDGDLLLLGARTLEGLNLAVDARGKRLIAAGPPPVATGTRARRSPRFVSGFAPNVVGPTV